MFESVVMIFSAIWQQDFTVLMNEQFTTLIYIIIGFLILLESGFIPASPLPCDSVVVLAGILAAVGVLDPMLILTVITVSAAVGSELGYLQGKKLNEFPKVRRWIAQLPEKKVNQADLLLNKYGFVSLFFARFIPVARSLVPLMMGIRNNNRKSFHLLSLSSAFIWTLILMGMGYLVSSLPSQYSQIVTTLLMLLPISIGVLTLLIFVVHKVKASFQRSSLK